MQSRRAEPPLLAAPTTRSLTPLAYTLIAALAGGVLSTLAAAVTLALGVGAISRLVSFAVGALLGAVFIELLPHALEAGSPERVMITVLCGLLAFFLLEKLVLWRHSHGHEDHRDDAEESEHDHALHAHSHNDGGRSGLMILIGNSVHNFCDGVVIAAAFLADVRLGVATTIAIVAHAVPQQVGDFAILIHSGFSRGRAFAFNITAGFATVVGALAGYFALAELQNALPTVLAVAAASLLYVAVADLIPSLHRRAEPLETAKQMAFILLGVASIGGTHLLLAH